MKRLLLIVLIFTFLVGCAEANTQEDQNEQAPALEEITSTSGPDCYGPEIHPVGQSIAEQFEEQTSYDQVMVWFCNGALFDDILTALQTEKLTGVHANDLLEMQAGGLTWDQIWTEIGLTEE